MTPQYDVAISDVVFGLRDWQMWARLGWQENKRRYRRTMIGPFWTTLSLGIFIGALGIVWAKLWGQDPKNFMPYFCAGMIVWAFVSTIISESCVVFVSAEALIKQLQFPYSLLACSVVWRNLIVFFHNIVIFVFVGLYAEIQVTWNVLWVIPALLLICVNGIWVSVFLGMLCSRFRDVQQVITSILNVAVFVTPIIWSIEQLGPRGAELMKFNVLYHIINLVRSPLLGKAPELINWAVVLTVLILGWALTLFLYSRFRRRIPYWL